MKGPEFCSASRKVRRLPQLSHLAACGLLFSLFTLPSQAQDLAEFRAAALSALGGEVSGIEFTGSGWDACLGQPWAISEGWARWELTDYRGVIDYRNGRSSHMTQRRAGMDPGRLGGCGAQPDAAPAPQRGFIDDSAPWPDQLPLWLTPHGFLHLLDQGTAALAQDGDGWQVSLTLPRDGIEYELVAHFDSQHRLERIATHIDDGIFGDMEVQATFGGYRDFGELNFPASYTLNQGGFPVLSLTIESAAPSTESLEPPPPRGGAGPPAAAAPEYQQIGPGIIAILGAYQSVAVEFSDHIVVIDGLQSDARVREVIRIVKAAIPSKPIRYVVSTHNHFDHAYGIRQFLAEGATVLTHRMNVAFFDVALATPRTLRHEATEPNEVPVRVQGVDGMLRLSDASGQVVELHALGASHHAADMLIAYLPSIKTIVEADILQPWINPVFDGGRDGPHPMLSYLAEELEELGLDYERFVPIHTPPDPPFMQRADLEAALRGDAQ